MSKSPFYRTGVSKSPFQHGDGSGKAPVSGKDQRLLNAKKEFNNSMPEKGDYTQEQYDNHDANLKSIRESS